jgi:hypothetical protein
MQTTAMATAMPVRFTMKMRPALGYSKPANMIR